MALVSYDYGSGSDENITDEEDEVAQSAVLIKKQNTSEELHKSENVNGIDSKTESSLFSKLPEVKVSESQITEENDQLEDFIPTVKMLKEKKKVQIMIPSLSDFDEPNADEPQIKRLKPSEKGSGLLSILPPVQSVPMSNTMFVPNSLSKKTAPVKPASTSKTVTSQLPKKDLVKSKTPIVNRNRTESDSDTDNEDLPIPETFDDQMWEKVCGRPKTKPKPVAAKVDLTAPENIEEYSSAPEPKKPYDGLNNEAFKELVGKTKRSIGNIKFIDINEDEILPDKDLWLTKSLTDPDLAPKATPQDTVDPTRKRKHHITYLAQQAKANEQELKSAWAIGKNNRMMSRAKYGF